MQQLDGSPKGCSYKSVLLCVLGSVLSEYNVRCSCCVMIVGCACRRGDDFHTTVMRADLSATARVGLFAIIVALPAGYRQLPGLKPTETRQPPDDVWPWRAARGPPPDLPLRIFKCSSLFRSSVAARTGGRPHQSVVRRRQSETRTKRQYRAKTTIILFVHAPLFEPDRATVRYRN